MKKLTTLWLTLLVTLGSLVGCGTDLSSTGIIGSPDESAHIELSKDGSEQTQDLSEDPNTDGSQPDADEKSNGSSGLTPETFGPAITGTETIIQGKTVIEEEGCYTSKEEVALYLMKYNMLPGNYITKNEAKSLGWEGGSLDSFAPGKSIGGDHFGNYEGSLPEADGRSYTECDIDSGPEGRGAKRIIFSNDGLIFYTEDHYVTFTYLTGG